MSQINYVWNGLNTAPQPPSWPAVGLDWLDSIFYVSSKPSKTQPAVWVAIGGGPDGGPVIQAALQEINTTVPQTLTITAVATTLYAISIYMKAIGTASAGHEVTATITYISADDSDSQSIDLILPLDTANVVMETYPLLVLAGTPLTLSTTYSGGATNDPYTISVRLVEMPGVGL
jgi:hypothetical protein